MTCEVGLSRSVRAFHIMPGMAGPEGQLHDHDYRIEIVVDRERLDERGMVCDLDVLEAALTELTSRVKTATWRRYARPRPRRSRSRCSPRWVHDTLSPVVAAAGGEPWPCECGKPCRVWRIPRTGLTPSGRSYGMGSVTSLRTRAEPFRWLLRVLS